VPAILEEVTPTGTVRYFRTPDGALIAGSKGSEWRFYHYDELGSTRVLTDGSGSVTDRYSYDAYGSVTSHIGSTTDNPYQYVGALGYYTHYQDPDFRLLEPGSAVRGRARRRHLLASRAAMACCRVLRTRGSG